LEDRNPIAANNWTALFVEAPLYCSGGTDRPETRRHTDIACDIGVGSRIVGREIVPRAELIARQRHRSYLGPIRAMVDRLRNRTQNSPVGFASVGQGVLADLKLRSRIHVGGHVCQE